MNLVSRVRTTSGSGACGAPWTEIVVAVALAHFVPKFSTSDRTHARERRILSTAHRLPSRARVSVFLLFVCGFVCVCVDFFILL